MTCSVLNCERPRFRRCRMCAAHYARKRRHGDPQADKPIGSIPAWPKGFQHQRGSRNTQAKLNNARVREIRASSERHETLATLHGVSTTAIGRVLSRKTWRHVL